MKIAPVYPHGPLQELAPGLWQVTGSTPRSVLPRNMVVFRLPDGGLWIHSGVALDEPGMAGLEALGQPRVLVVPNAFHRMDAPFYKQRYPGVQVVCPAVSERRVTARVAVDGYAEELLPPLGIICHQPAGMRPFELAYELPLAEGRALVVTDLLFNLRLLPGFGGWLLRVGGSAGFFGITALGRLMGLKDWAAFKAWLEAMAGLPGLRAICVAHGEAILADCAGRLREAAARLA